MKIVMPQKLIGLFSKYLKKIIIIILIAFSLYNIYFLYQNFYLVLIDPLPVDQTLFQWPADNKTDRLYDALKEKMDIKVKSILDIADIQNPF